MWILTLRLQVTDTAIDKYLFDLINTETGTDHGLFMIIPFA